MFKSIFINIISLLMTLGFLGIQNACKTVDELTPPKPEMVVVDSIQLSLLWQQPLNPLDTGYYASFQPVLFDGGVLFNLMLFKDWDILQFFDAATGEQLWEWEDHIGPGFILSETAKALEEDVLYCSSVNEYYAIDLKSGHTIWSYNDPNYGGPQVTVIGDYLYRTQVTPNLSIGVESNLMRTKINTAQPHWESVVSLSKIENDGYRPNIFSPSLWMHPSGDSILIFQNKSYNFSLTQGKNDLYAYNLSKAEMLWKLEDVSPGMVSNGLTPFVQDDKIYFFAGRSIRCFEALTGEMIWEKLDFSDVSEHFNTSNYFIENGILVANADNDYVYGLDPNTGNEIWKQTKTGGSVTVSIVHDGLLYFSSGGDGHLYAVRISDGKLLSRFSSPNKKAGFPNASFANGGPVIDANTNRLYISDGHFASCYQIEYSNDQFESDSNFND